MSAIGFITINTAKGILQNLRNPTILCVRAYLDKLKAKHAGNVYLMKLYDICKCPVCDKFHLIPKKVIYDDKEMWKYII